MSNERSRTWRWCAWLGYALVVGSVTTTMLSARRHVLVGLDTPAARQHWDQWREDVRQGRDSQSTSVSRRVPRAQEPPALVLMRDYFVVCLTGAIFFTSVLYAVACFFMAGALIPAPSRSVETDHQPDIASR